MELTEWRGSRVLHHRNRVAPRKVSSIDVVHSESPKVRCSGRKSVRPEDVVTAQHLQPCARQAMTHIKLPQLLTKDCLYCILFFFIILRLWRLQACPPQYNSSVIRAVIDTLPSIFHPYIILNTSVYITHVLHDSSRIALAR